MASVSYEVEWRNSIKPSSSCRSVLQGPPCHPQTGFSGVLCLPAPVSPECCLTDLLAGLSLSLESSHFILRWKASDTKLVTETISDAGTLNWTGSLSPVGKSLGSFDPFCIYSVPLKLSSFGSPGLRGVVISRTFQIMK